MNLRTEIRPELWEAIATQYEAELYSSAIIEAIHYLSNSIRERANVDGDGIALIGQALGGDQPRLRINKFQTESEKNEQKGLETMLRGLYQGIRNPRAHEQTQDTQSTANAVILFVNYVLEIIGQAKQPFSLDDWIVRVYDPNFVTSSRYAELLVAEVPPKKRMEALITVYRGKTRDNSDKYRFVYKELMTLIGDEQLGDFITIVSDELKTVQGENNIIAILRVFPPRLWPQVKEIARLRIENRLIQSIRDGSYDSDFDKTSAKGILGTWASLYLQYFTLKRDLSNALLDKLKSTNIEEQDYVFKYFLWLLPDTLNPDMDSYAQRRRELYIEAIANSLLASNGFNYLRSQILSLRSWPEDWQNLIIEKLEPLKTSEPDYYEQLIASKEDYPF